MNEIEYYDGDLYIGRIAESIGFIRTSQDTLPVILWGEVLLYGRIEDEVFHVDKLRRVALYGQLINPVENERIGVISLSSSVISSIDDIVLHMHYAALTDELDPAYEGDGFIVPQFELIQASLGWQVQTIVGDSEVQLQVELAAEELIKRELGVIEQVNLEDSILFQLAGTGGPRPEPSYSLSSNCPPSPGCPPDSTICTRTLAIKFTNLSRFSLQDNNVAGSGKNLETLCQEQIDGACEVWRNKSALDLVIESHIMDGSTGDKGRFRTCSDAEEIQIKSSGYAVVTQVEIYLVDRLLRWPEGGVTHDQNEASAYCILSVRKMTENPHLLSHELCHVMGLVHPDAPEMPGVVMLGSFDSIAQAGTPNSSMQSQDNLQIFIDPDFPLNPIVETTTTRDCFWPDF